MLIYFLYANLKIAKRYDYKGIPEGPFKKPRSCGMIGESTMKNPRCIGHARI